MRPARSSPPLFLPLRPCPLAKRVDVVVVGISTGGPQALRFLLPQFAEDFPVPILVVLHMPVGYTAPFAEQLNGLTRLVVKEAAEGDWLEPGTITMARAGWHLQVKRHSNGKGQLHLSSVPEDKPHRPSVDVLFQSAAESYRDRVLGVVMTGMGEDGKQGAAWIKANGGMILTEAEESCVIYGMPRAVAESGLSDASFPLDSMAQGITKYL
jgi:two-component system chemotaxis response regulator CheB